MSGGHTDNEQRFAWKRHIEAALEHVRNCQECAEAAIEHSGGSPRQAKLSGPAKPDPEIRLILHDKGW